MRMQGIDEPTLVEGLGRLAARFEAPGLDELSRMAQIAAQTPGAAGAHGVRTVRRRARRHPSARLIAALGISAALLAFAVAGHGLLRRPEPAAADVRFSRTPGFIVARIADPEASARSLRRAFERQGFDIHLSLAPVSPSLVGTVLYVGGDGNGGGGIEALQGGTCVTGGGGCPIGLRIPPDYRGTAYVTLGRGAHPGESYASEASVFAPGEPLRCSGLIGTRVSHAARALAARGYSVRWRLYDATNDTELDLTAIGGYYVVDADRLADDRRLTVSVSPRPTAQLGDQGLTAYLARLDGGC